MSKADYNSWSRFLWVDLVCTHIRTLFDFEPLARASYQNLIMCKLRSIIFERKAAEHFALEKVSLAYKLMHGGDLFEEVEGF